MEAPIYESKFGFSLFGMKPETVQVFPDRIVHSQKIYLDKAEVIFLDQITGIEAFSVVQAKIEIKTNDGRSHLMHVKAKDKQQLLAAIYEAKQKNKKG